MAKYRINNIKGSYRDVKCDILNESDGKYVVRFSNGVIKTCDKNRVHSLNRIDEGVLQALNNVISSVIAKIGFSLRKIGKFFRIFDKNGRELDINLPINTMIAAKDTDNITFVPGSVTRGFCKDLGENSYATINVDCDESLDDDYPVGLVMGSRNILKSILDEKNAASFANESYIYENGRKVYTNFFLNEKKFSDVYKPAFGSELDYAELETDDGKAITQSDSKLRYITQFSDIGHHDDKRGDAFSYIPLSKVYELLKNQLNALRHGNPELPLLLWGPPSVAKTSIVYEFVNDMRGVHPEFDIINVNARTMSEDDLNLPYLKGKESKIVTASMALVDWVPAYDERLCKGNKDIKEFYDNIANGGYWKDSNGNVVSNIDEDADISTFEKVEGAGGIIFFDEFSRIAPNTLDSIMSFLSERVVGQTSFRLGSKWLIVCAANRSSDLTPQQREKFTIDKAGITRTTPYGVVLTFREWYDWATEMVSVDIPGTEGKNGKCEKRVEQRIVPLITDFLSSPEYNHYYYYVEDIKDKYKDDPEFADYEPSDARLAQGMPRMWADFSKSIKSSCTDSDEDLDAMFKKFLKKRPYMKDITDDSNDYNVSSNISDALLYRIGPSKVGNEITRALVNFKKRAPYLNRESINMMLDGDFDNLPEEFFDTRNSVLMRSVISSAFYNMRKHKVDEDGEFIDRDQIFNLFKYIVEYSKLCGLSHDGKGGPLGILDETERILTNYIENAGVTYVGPKFIFDEDFMNSDVYKRCYDYLSDYRAGKLNNARNNIKKQRS